MQGAVLLRRNFFVWVVFSLLMWAMVFVASRIAFLPILLALLTPVFLAGIMIGARAVEKGEELEIAHFFAGFRTHGVSLVALGGFYLVGNMIIGLVMTAIGGEAIQQIVAGQAGNVDPEILMQAMGPAVAALSTGVLLSVPLSMALWFAPMIVVFRGEKPGPALRLSFGACLANMKALFVYGLILFVPLVLLMALFDLTSMDRNPGLWIVALIVMPSLYTSYRDIFAEPVAPAA